MRTRIMAVAAKKTTTRATKSGAARARAASTGAKVPQDRAQKAEAVGGLVTVEVRGFQVTIDPDAVNDYRIISQPPVMQISAMMEALVPDVDVRGALVATCAVEGGRIPIEAVGELLDEITALAGQGK